jgi:general secretion pathway protein E
MRVFDPEVLQRSFNELGIADRELDLWSTLTKRTYGIILVTGPTGSGKTTTLYSTLKKLATSEVNVCTIEDPIEMVEATFNQMQVHNAIGLDFASGVKALLRQDPDIIMIGEIRDLETAEMAIQASLTGHLVLATLHTNDASSAIVRLRELGIPDYLINASVLGVMAQRLIRKLCPHCKQKKPINKEVWTNATSGWKITPSNTSESTGCLECRQTGYQGRIGLYEMLEVTPASSKLIGAHATLEEMQEQSIKDGLIPLKISGLKKVAEGETSLEEVLRVAPI